MAKHIKGARYSFREETETQIFYIYDINEVIILNTE